MNYKERTPAIRILGALLIAAAVALHVYNVRSARARAQGAAALRELAAAPALQLGIRAGAADFQIWPPDAVPFFRARLAAAKPGAPPKDASLEYEFSLVLTNHVRALLHAVRAPGSDDLYVSLREPAKTGAANAAAAAFRDWPPALVTGLGILLDYADAGTLSVPVLVRRTGDHGFDQASLADTAASLRHVAALPAKRARFIPAGGRARDLPADSLPALAAALAAAEPAELPEGGSIEGNDGTLLLFLDDGFVAMLRAAVPDEAPDDALVGFREIAATPGPGAPPPRLDVSAPARVPGLGRLLLPSPAP